MPAVKECFPPILAQRDAIFPALFAAVAAMIVVSLFTPQAGGGAVGAVCGVGDHQDPVI